MTTRVISQRVIAEYEQYRRNVFSQTGEDGVIEYFLKRIGVEMGYFVEFGAWDGKHLSNCAYLAQKGWSGCFIEGDSERFLDLVANYGDNDKITKLNRFVMPEGENSLDALLRGVQAPATVDVLSIDVDGLDHAIWEGVSTTAASLVIIEFNPTIPANVVVSQDHNDASPFGNSLAALWELGLAKGYQLVATTDWNAFFIRNEDCKKHKIPSYRPWELKDTRFETYLFSGYNGKIRLSGDQTLIWHGVPIREAAVQVLPEDLQRFPDGHDRRYMEKLDKFREFLRD